MTQTPQQKIEEDIKEFDEFWTKLVGKNAALKDRLRFEDFTRQLLKSRDSYWLKKIEEGLGEEGIVWMQEGSRKGRKGFTDGFNYCRSLIKKRLLK